MNVHHNPESHREPVSDAPSPATAIAIVRGELSAKRRWVYRVLLLVASGALAALLSLWGTEPGPLPTRLHIAFAALAMILSGWVGVSSWILTRRNCPTALDRLATSWMATIACLLFLVVAVSIAMVRGETMQAATLALVGVMFLATALLLLRQAYAKRSELQRMLERVDAGSTYKSA
jgi:hypothetical protein